MPNSNIVDEYDQRSEKNSIVTQYKINDDNDDQYDPSDEDLNYEAYSPSFTKTPIADFSGTHQVTSTSKYKFEPKSPTYNPLPINTDDEQNNHDDNEEDEDDDRNQVAANEQDDDDQFDFDGFEVEQEDEENKADDANLAAGHIIADIFGESDHEEDFEGFAENEIETVEKQVSASNNISRSRAEDEDDDGDQIIDSSAVSDFDLYLEKKKEENRRKRHREKDVDFLNDSDEIIASCIKKMRQAAETDRMLFESGKPAVRKLAMVPNVTKLLKKAGFQNILIENGMLSAITDWLSPMPNHILPSLPIREVILCCLQEFKSLPSDVLKESGLGKAIMYLYKHPQETRANKTIAGRLINEWSRPIFNLQSDYKNMSKEERRKLTAEQLPKKRNFEKRREEREEPQEPLRPGDAGFVSRARVPQPSRTDYVIAPKWNIPEAELSGHAHDDAEDEGDIDSFRRRLAKKALLEGNSKQAKIAGSRLENSIKEITKSAHINAKKKFTRAVPMSLEGRKVAL